MGNLEVGGSNPPSATLRMQKQVVIVHRWGGSPEADWYPWLKKELESRGIKCTILKMSNTEYPDIVEWVNHINNSIKNPDENAFLVGHSIGCQAIIRYLETLPKNTKLGGALFVAGWFTLQGLETEEEIETAKPWLESPINFNQVKKALFKSAALFSDNDPYVPISNAQIFREKLGSKIIIEKSQGHYNENKVPTILEEILELIK